MSNTLELRKKCIAKNFDKIQERYDDDYGMLASDVKPFSGGSGGYHTRVHGHLHHINTTTEHAAMIFFLENNFSHYFNSQTLHHDIIFTKKIQTFL